MSGNPLGGKQTVKPLNGEAQGRFKPYPKYKDSGVEWLGPIPEHWDLRRMKYIAVIQPNKKNAKELGEIDVSFIPMENVGAFGGIIVTETKKASEIDAGYSYFEENDILVAKITPCFENIKGAVARGLKNCVGFGTTELYIVRPLPCVDTDYLAFITYGTHFRRRGKIEMKGTAGQQRIPEDFVRDFPCTLPPCSEQRDIVRFLDKETVRIDDLVDRKQRLIELQKEKRAALINQAVTKGLDPNVPMKDSGIEWLEKVPKHWNMYKLGYIANSFGGSTPNKANDEYWKGNIPWVSPKDMKRRRINDSEDHVSEKAIQHSSLHKIQPPAILIVVRGMILAHTFPIAITSGMVTINQDMKALRVKPGFNVDYVAYLLEGISAYILSVIEDSAHGTKRLRTKCWNSIKLFLPTEDEQLRIHKYLDDHCLKIDRLLDETRGSILKLREYRSALITAAVTGKIDVRGE